jgi:mono/diheme cytochrome c family protein
VTGDSSLRSGYFRSRSVAAPTVAAQTVGVLAALLLAQVAMAGNGNPGREAYLRYCSSCHGITGQGNGEVADSLRTPPTDLTQLAQKHGGAFPNDEVREIIDGRKRIAAHGSSAMPVWGQVFVEERTYEVPEAHARSQVSLIASYLAAIQTVQPAATAAPLKPD